MIDKDFLNEIWFIVASNKTISINDIVKKTGCELAKAQKMLAIMLANGILLLDEKTKLFSLNEYTAELYAKSITLGLNVLYLDRFVVLSREEKIRSSQIILSGAFNKKEQQKKKQNKSRKKIEELKEANWLLILNDVKKILPSYKDDKEKEEEYKILLGIKTELEKSLKEYFIANERDKK